MRTHNFTYYGRSITRVSFENAVPGNWESDLDEFGNYSFGGFDAISIK